MKSMYYEMSAPELLKACGDSGERWAEAFMEIVVGGTKVIDLDLMRAWFANAIETSHDVRRWSEKP